MAFEFKLPDIGEGIHEGEIVQWLVSVGDIVAEDQPLVEVMTDKVTAEIPAPVSGTVKELRGQPGEVIRVGAVIVVIEEGAAGGKPVTAKNVEATASIATPTQVPTAPAAETTAAPHQPTNGKAKTAVLTPPVTSGKVLAAPATRKLARQLGVDLALVQGSGPRGRITPDDVRRGPASGASPAAMARPGQFVSGQDKRVPFAGMRRKIAEHLVKSKHTAPHFAYVEEVDMSRLVAMREDLLPLAEAQGVKLSYLPFLIKAVVAGLQQYPMLNAQLDEEKNEIVYKGAYHMGVAVATDQGLIVPVVKHADQKSLFTIAREITELAGKARQGKLALDDLKGGTFTLTSIGSIGGMFSVPIINHPEVAIMGINKIEKRPVVRDGQIVIRDMMYLSISCDHRVVDGAEAALFVKFVMEQLESPARLFVAV